MDRGRKGEGVKPGIYAHDVGFCICICSAHGILSGCVHYSVHIRGAGVSATASPDELPSPYSYNSYISSHHPHCPSCQVGIIIYSWALGEGCDLDIQSPFHPSVNPKVVRTYLKPSFDPDEADSTTQQTPHTHSRRATIMKYWSYFSSPPYPPRSHHRLLDNTPPSSPLTISSHPPSVNLNCSTHTTHRATIPRPALRNYKSQNASLPFLTPQSVLCLPMLPAIVCYDRPPLALPCEHKMQIWPPCLLASDFPNLRVNQTIVTAHPVIEFLPM